MLPGMGVDPQKLAQVQLLSHHIKGTITVNHNTDTVTLHLVSEVPEAKELIPQLLSQFSESLATQIHSYFAIKGEIVEIAKKD